MKLKFIVVFKILNFDSINFYFDMTIIKNRINHVIHLNQKIYIKRVVIKFDLQNVKSMKTFMKEFFDFISNINQINDQNIKLYQNMIKSIMFAMIKIKSNITNVVFIINCFVQNFNFNHIKIVKRIINYLNFTHDKKIIYDDNNFIDFIVQIYCDVDWIKNKISKKFIDAYFFY